MKFKWNIKKVEVDYFGIYSKEQLEQLEDEFRYIEVIDFKCLNCKESAELEADIVFECFNPRHQDYPIFTCTHCNKDKLVPLDVFNQLSSDYYFPFDD